MRGTNRDLLVLAHAACCFRLKSHSVGSLGLYSRDLDANGMKAVAEQHIEFVLPTHQQGQGA